MRNRGNLAFDQMQLSYHVSSVVRAKYWVLYSRSVDSIIGL